MSREHQVEKGLKKLKEQNTRESSLALVEKEALATAKNMVECLDSPFLREEWPEKPEIWIKNAIMEAIQKYDIAIDIKHNQFLRDRNIRIQKYKIGQTVKFNHDIHGEKESEIKNIHITLGEWGADSFPGVFYELDGWHEKFPEGKIQYVTKE